MVEERAGRAGPWRVAMAAALALAGVLVVTAAIGIERASSAPLQPFGRFVSVCDFSHQSNNDPIVLPRKPGLSHLHQFFGNDRTGARATPKKLRRKGGTTCQISGDKSAYWTPTLEVDGRVVTADMVRVYYSDGGKASKSIRAFPRGLRVIAGNAGALSPQPVNVLHWSCYGADGVSVLLPATSTAPTCRQSARPILNVFFPDCWDGERAKSPDHASHLAYAQKATLGNPRRTCPASHPVPLPAMALKVIYPRGASVGDVELSSGSIYSAHADFMNGWKRRALAGLLEDCIHAARDCKGR